MDTIHKETNKGGKNIYIFGMYKNIDCVHI